jgi:DNA-3-methyladenine glycosylase
MNGPALPALGTSFFSRPAEVVAPELVGCLLVRQPSEGEPLWGMVVETEAYSQSEPACHGHRRRSPSNETLFGAPGRFYVYLTYGMHHCVNVVTDRSDWANGVLLRAVALPGLPERSGAGPGLLARSFGIDRQHNNLPAAPASGLWLAPRPPALQEWLDREAVSGGEPIRQTVRIGISLGQEIPWRWYLRASRSVSRRAPGDPPPRRDHLAAGLADGWADAGLASTVRPSDASSKP